MQIEYRELTVDGAKLRGFLTKPDDGFKDIVVYLHGFTGHKNEHNFMFKNLSIELAKVGIASLRYDYRGSGDSDLDFSDQSFDTVLADGEAMIKEAKALNGGKPVIVLGFSMGGANAARQSVMHNEDIKKLILISPAGHLEKSLQRIFEVNKVIDEKFVDIGGYYIGINFKESLDNVDLYEGVENFKKPVLIIQGSADLAVNPIDSKRYATLYEKSRYVVVEDATHGYDKVEYRNKIKEEVIKFINEE